MRQSLGLSVKDYITYIGTFLYVTYSGTFRTYCTFQGLSITCVRFVVRHVGEQRPGSSWQFRDSRQNPNLCQNLVRPLLEVEPHRLRHVAARSAALRASSAQSVTVRYGDARYGTVRYGDARYGTVRYGDAS